MYANGAAHLLTTSPQNPSVGVSLEIIVCAAFWQHVRRPRGLIPRCILMYERYLAEVRAGLDDFKSKFPTDDPELRVPIAELMNIVGETENIIEGLKYQGYYLKRTLVEALQPTRPCRLRSSALVS